MTPMKMKKLSGYLDNYIQNKLTKENVNNPIRVGCDCPGCGMVTTDTILMKTSKFGSFDQLKTVLEYEPDLEIKDNSGKTALFQVFVINDYKYPHTYDTVAKLNLLLESKANANAKSDNGFTPLMSIIQQTLYFDTTDYTLNMISELIKKSDVNHQASNDCNNVSALMIAAGLDELKIVQMLVDTGANISLKDFEGKSAIDYVKDTWTGTGKPRPNATAIRKYLTKKLQS